MGAHQICLSFSPSRRPITSQAAVCVPKIGGVWWRLRLRERERRSRGKRWFERSCCLCSKQNITWVSLKKISSHPIYYSLTHSLTWSSTLALALDLVLPHALSIFNVYKLIIFFLSLSQTISCESFLSQAGYDDEERERERASLLVK